MTTINIDTKSTVIAPVAKSVTVAAVSNATTTPPAKTPFQLPI
ncbi:MAG: hypothetical protein ACR5K2_00140 [Wolbachia sp.]